MNMIELLETVSDESKTLKYLEKKYGKRISCKHCKSKTYYYMKSKNRIRCKKCKKDIRAFEDTLLVKIKMPYSKWLVLIKLFQLSVTANEAASQADLSYKTALKAYDIFRWAIVMNLAKKDKALRGEIEL